MNQRRIFCTILAFEAAIASPSLVRGQAFDCVHLNDDNTNIFTVPDECFLLPEHLTWCNCVRSLFTHPVKGEKSGFNQAVQWITKQPGIGNHRVEVAQGTLDLSGLAVGTVIGKTLVNELIPQSVGVPPNTFFKVLTEIVVTGLHADSVDFDIVAKELTPASIAILRYNPLDACHSFGVQYNGTLTSLGPSKGFVLEYRYPKDLIVADAACQGAHHSAFQHPGIDPGDADAPGFTVRFIMTFFSEASGIYTLPTNTNTVGVATTLRRFTFRGETDPSLDEILDLGAEDLCFVREVPEADPTPCKLIDEVLQIKTTADENSPPTARIVMLDPFNASLIPDPADVQKACGEARVLMSGANSEDGDGGTQTLSHDWFVVSGPAGGATIPADTIHFKDTEITFKMVGTYEIGLRVNDGGTGTSTDEVTVTVTVHDDNDFNVPPTAEIKTTPDPAEVELVGGAATIQLDGSTSSNGALGQDDCMQTLAYKWTQVDGSHPAVILSPTLPTTDVKFAEPGDYSFELEVNDGQEIDNIATIEALVTVTGLPAKTKFKRGDSDANGALELTDAVRTLNWLFLGGSQPPCLDAADSDDSGKIDISDAVKILNYLFIGSAPPAAPGPDICGEDPVADDLAECVYDRC